MTELLEDLNLLTKCHGGKLPARLIEWAREECDEITSRGLAATGGVTLSRPPGQAGKRGGIAKQKYRNLLERHVKHKDEVLSFTTDVNVPFANNDAERPIRILKLRLKASGCFRSRESADGFLRIMGYADSCRKNGINGYEAINMLMSGKTPEFIKKWLNEAFQKAA